MYHKRRTGSQEKYPGGADSAAEESKKKVANRKKAKQKRHVKPFQQKAAKTHTKRSKEYKLDNCSGRGLNLWPVDTESGALPLNQKKL